MGSCTKPHILKDREDKNRKERKWPQKPKETKRAKILTKILWPQWKYIFFSFHGGGAIGKMPLGSCFHDLCSIDAITMESYAPGLFHLQEPHKMS